MRRATTNTGLCFSVFMGILVLPVAGQAENIKEYPISGKVLTTLQRTVMPDDIPANAQKVLPFEISKFKKSGYGKWHYGPGLAYEKRLDIMPANYNPVSATKAVRLLHFFSITDIHISDKETPAQLVYFGLKDSVSSAYSPVMLYTTHVLDAAMQTINALNKKEPVDFGISLGDTCNSTQYNELRWYVDVLDGKIINPDSGVKDDPIPGPNNDYQDEYKAVGLDKSIPWYQAMGNHDHFWIGTYPPNDYLRQAYLSKEILNIGDLIMDSRGVDSRGFYMGSLDGSTQYGDIIGAGPVDKFASPPQVAAADPNRRSLTRKEWLAEFFNTSSKPVGHGFSQANVDTGFANYTFEPKSDLPLKVIVLDDTEREDQPDARGFGHGSLDAERYDWLVKELDQGQAEGKLMIIAAHIPVGIVYPPKGIGAFMAWSADAAVTEPDLIAKLHEYPNLIMWIAGHRHVNQVTAFKSPDADHPELGFWQVETASLRDFPQQFRTFEIVRNTDKTISILTTDVDPAVKTGSFADTSRTYGVAAQHLYKNDQPYLPSGSYNAELVKQLTPEMQEKIWNVGAKPSK